MARGVAVPRRAAESTSSRSHGGGDCTSSSSRSRYRTARAFHRARIAPDVNPPADGDDHSRTYFSRRAAGTTSESDWPSTGIETLHSRTPPERDGRGETGSPGRRVKVPRCAGASRRRSIGNRTVEAAGSCEPKPACCLTSARARKVSYFCTKL